MRRLGQDRRRPVTAAATDFTTATRTLTPKAISTVMTL
jgi:hypothetical protein